jgi:hypothetical protein
MTVLVTRRTLRRTHLFRPDAELNQFYQYVLAVTAERHGVLVHAVVLMSTHEHLVLTDPRGRLPLFLRELHRLFALGVKMLRRWDGAVWDHERPSVVELRTPEAIIEKLGYVIANPVAAGLVRYARDWPGVATRAERLGCTRLLAKRPALYFDENNPMWPSEAELELSMPRIGNLSDDEIRSAVANEVAEHELQARADARHKGSTFVGAERVRKASPYDRAKSWEPLRGRNPRFAVGKGQKSAHVDAVAALRAFRRAYRAALDSWQSGLRSVCFPVGTWAMRVVHAACVAQV